MSKVFIIAEAALCWMFGPNPLENAYRMIRACAAAGASAFKTQWTSDHEAMEMRRGVARGQYKRLQWGAEALPLLKAECDRVGIEFMSTVFIPKDIPTIAQYVKRFKVSAFESGDKELLTAIGERPCVISINPEKGIGKTMIQAETLHCISKYPTRPEDLGMRTYCEFGVTTDGLSDHTTSTLTGAVAVGAGARIIEKHVRLHDTPESDPDYGHSLCLEDPPFGHESSDFYFYVQNIRTAERML